MRKKQSRADVSATRRTMAVSEEDLTKLLKQRLTYCMEIEDISKRLQELQDKIETDGDDWGHRLLGFSVNPRGLDGLFEKERRRARRG